MYLSSPPAVTKYNEWGSQTILVIGSTEFGKNKNTKLIVKNKTSEDLY